jgi:hypothetical protein
MTLATLVLAQMFRLTAPQLLQPPPSKPPTVPQYRLVDFAEAVERDAERCICTTTRLSPATLRAEVLLVSDCECGK